MEYYVTTVSYRFGSNDTIRGIIRKLNSHNLDESVLQKLMAHYNNFNNCAIPRVGSEVKIPMIVDHKTGVTL